MPAAKPIQGRPRPTVSKRHVNPSKRLVHRIRAAESLLGAIQHHKEEIAAGIREKLGPHLGDGETLPDQILLLELAGRSVKAALAALRKADERYCWNVQDRWGVSKECTRVAREEVYPELVDVRRAMDGRFGRQSAYLVHGMKGDTSRQAADQHPILQRLVRTLRAGPLPRPLQPDAPDERQTWLSQLEPGYRRLDGLLKELVALEHGEFRHRHNRDFEADCFDMVYDQALSYLRGALKVSGGDEEDVWHLLPEIQRRQLRRKARQEKEARAEGRRSKG